MVHFLIVLALSIALIAVLRAWRRDRRLLSESREGLRDREADRTAALEKANQDLEASQTDLQRRWQYLAEALQESKTRLEEAQRVAPVGHYEWNLVANRVTWSAELYRIYGLPPQEGSIDMAMVREMMHSDDRDHVFGAVEDVVRSGVNAAAEHRVVRPTGEVRTVQAIGTVKRDESGRAYEIFGTVQDSTDRKHAEEERQALSRDLKKAPLPDPLYEHASCSRAPSGHHMALQRVP